MVKSLRNKGVEARIVRGEVVRRCTSDKSEGKEEENEAGGIVDGEKAN